MYKVHIHYSTYEPPFFMTVTKPSFGLVSVIWTSALPDDTDHICNCKLILQQMLYQVIEMWDTVSFSLAGKCYLNTILPTRITTIFSLLGRTAGLCQQIPTNSNHWYENTPTRYNKMLSPMTSSFSTRAANLSVVSVGKYVVLIRTFINRVMLVQSQT